MKKSKKSGGDLLIQTLKDLNVKFIYGLPGTQNFHLYEAIRRSPIKTILNTNELMASFVANGYYRSSGEVGVLLTIPGPGFTYALTGLAEARLDSAALLYIICRGDRLPDKKFQLQEIDELAMASPVVKKMYTIRDISEIRNMLVEAYIHAKSDEPGPVIVDIPSSLLQVPVQSDDLAPAEIHESELDEKRVDEILLLIKNSKRAAVYLGQGAQGCSGQLAEFVDLIKAPVFTTTSGRGALSEKHPYAFTIDLVPGRTDLLNGIFEKSDLVIALGCKFSQNGSIGYSLSINPEKLLHVDASAEVLGANYPAKFVLKEDVSVFLQALLSQKDKFQSRRSAWSDQEFAGWRAYLDQNRAKAKTDPLIKGAKALGISGFFKTLSRHMGENACLVADSGLHQLLARKYYTVSASRGLLVPADFQSMGFGIPAGIGAKLASPDKKVAVVIGDGGFAISGMELMTAIRENLSIVVIVFNDKNLGLIRLHQLNEYGHSYAVKTGEMNFSLFSRALHIRYFKCDKNISKTLDTCFNYKGVCLLEVELEDSMQMRKRQLKNIIKNTVQKFY